MVWVEIAVVAGLFIFSTICSYLIEKHFKKENDHYYKEMIESVVRTVDNNTMMMHLVYDRIKAEDKEHEK